MISVMKMEAESIWLEPPGQMGIGIEFLTRTKRGLEFHQVKRQRGGHGYWSLNALASEGVLSHIVEKLQEPSTNFVFCSTHAAHPLDELSNQARDLRSWEQFKNTFLSIGHWSEDFQRLQHLWGAVDERKTFENLKCIYIQTIDESSLLKSLMAQLDCLVTGCVDNAVDVLSNLALARLHQDLTSENLWNHLLERGFNKQSWEHDTSVFENVEEMNSLYRSSLRPLEIAGYVVDRSEAKEILSHFQEGAQCKGALVTGQAGVGKSSVVYQVLTKMEERGIPYIAFRVDRLDPASAVSPTDLGKQFGLPKAPQTVLASIAKGQDCLLVVDQLDAVSLASGRYPLLLDCIGAILEQIQHYPKMKVLVACRKFDLEHDFRIQQLIEGKGIAKEFPVGLFDPEITKEVLGELGFDISKLNPNQITLLSLPLHLLLFSKTIQDHPIENIDFQSAKELFDRFWDYKLGKLEASSFELSEVNWVFSNMFNYMNKRESLSVPSSLLEQHRNVLSVLVSENILQRNGTNISFFHESFFDYLFAHTLESADFDLASYITDSSQSLFYRSQIRQILLHQRDTSPLDVLRSVTLVLSGKDIRPHLKAIVFALLGTVGNPTEGEWEVIEAFLGTELSAHARKAIRGSLPWFDLIDSLGILQEWLTSGKETLVNWAIDFLRAVQVERADRVSELLTPFVGFSDSWNLKLMDLVNSADLSASKAFFEMALEAVQKGCLDSLLYPEANHKEAWHLPESLMKSQPNWACILVAAILERLLFLAQKQRSNDPFPYSSDPHRMAPTVLEDLVRSVQPLIFVNVMLPVFSKTSEIYVDRIGVPPWRDSIWKHPNENPVYRTKLSEALIFSMEISLQRLASEEPVSFQNHKEFLESSEFLTFHYLLMRAYTGSGEHLAEEAAEYLLRKQTLWLTTGRNQIQSWVPRQLLEKISPHCSTKRFAELEKAILAFCRISEANLRLDNGNLFGMSQLELLGGLEAGRLSPTGTRRHKELRRKFPDITSPEPPIPQSGWVESPIPEDAARKMNDKQWLSAIKKHHRDSPLNRRGGIVVGGASQLSTVLQTLANEAPTRFAHLMRSIPDESNPAYFGAILRGIGSSALDFEVVVEACLRCRRISNPNVGKAAISAMENLTGSNTHPELLQLVGWYATKDPDPVGGPKTNGYWEELNPDFQDLVQGGMNTVRGSAALLVARLISRDSVHLAFFGQFLEIMVKDPSIEVRACVARTVLSVLAHDRDFAVRLFIQLSNTDDRLLTSDSVRDFLYFALSTHFQELEPTLIRMMSSSNEEVSAAGAMHICRASLADEDALYLAYECVAGPSSLKLGAAKVFAGNLKGNTYRAKCVEAIIKMFYDTDKEVRREASSCFLSFEGSDIRDFQNLIKAFINSPAFKESSYSLFYAMNKASVIVPEITLEACEQLYGMSNESVDQKDGETFAGYIEIPELVIRVYGRCVDQSTKTRCLDLIDQMTLLGTLGLDNINAEFDRQM